MDDEQQRIFPRHDICMALLSAFCVLSCAEDPFVAKYAPGLDRARQLISVFGVKRDGLMNRSGWAALGPYATTPFSDDACDLAYSDELFAAAPELAEAVDAYVRENGVTDELLDQLAPAAKGGLIMVLTVAGHPLGSVEGSNSSNPSSYSPSARPSGRRGNRRSSANLPREDASNGERFEVSASFFSVREHRAVALATLSSSGSNTDQALARFTSRLEREFPGSTCRGWDWSVHLDDKKIRKLGEP